MNGRIEIEEGVAQIEAAHRRGAGREPGGSRCPVGSLNYILTLGLSNSLCAKLHFPLTTLSLSLLLHSSADSYFW